MCKIEERVLEEILLYSAPRLNEKYGVDIYFTSRLGGYSKGKYSSLNLAFHVGDGLKLVKRNRYKLRKTLKLNNSMQYLKQSHSDKIIFLKNLENKEIPEADALVTNLKNIPVMVMGADCNLIIIVDKLKKVVAAVHAGWEGTLNRILQKTIKFLKDNFNSKSLLFYIGPSIRKCCYRVSKGRAELFIKEFGDKKFYYQEKGQTFLDLVGINKNQILDFNIPSKNIYDCHVCTFCDQRFYSYRRNKITGRQGAITVIRK